MRISQTVESHFLVEPIPSSGTLRSGAPTGSSCAGSWTISARTKPARPSRAPWLPRTSWASDNVATVTGVPFSTLTPEWQLANYLDNLPGFAPSSPRLQYDSWNFRATYASFHEQAPTSFPREYPLVPDSTLTGVYAAHRHPPRRFRPARPGRAAFAGRCGHLPAYRRGAACDRREPGAAAHRHCPDPLTHAPVRRRARMIFLIAVGRWSSVRGRPGSRARTCAT